MQIDILIEEPRWQDIGLEQLARTAADAVRIHLGLSPETELSILACNDARIAVLNTEFRGKPTPTNVLSWPDTDLSANDDGDPPRHPAAGTQSIAPANDFQGKPVENGPDEGFLGDIAIAYDTCAREATEQGLTMANHTIHLIIHGILHLLGYDHERDRDATLMEGLETVILGKLGIADPYRDS